MIAPINLQAIPVHFLFLLHHSLLLNNTRINNNRILLNLNFRLLDSFFDAFKHYEL